MKRCPECRRDYYDDTLLYCLDDGNALLEGPASGSDAGAEPATAILHATEPPGEAATRAQIHMTDQTAVLPTGMGDVAPKTRGFEKRLIAAPLLALLIAVTGYVGYRYLGPFGSTQIDSIAVMPFVNESGNADVEYLSDGMTETLISSLSQLPNLNVKARSSVFRYKGKETDAQTIGKELNVQAILHGRVVQRGQDLILYIELVDAATENSLWKQSYNKTMTNLVALQNDIARDVADKLKVKLSGADGQKLTKNYTANPEAYRLYLQGRFFWNKRRIGENAKAIDYFQQAIAVDPNFALAYAGYADAVSQPSDVVPHAEREKKAKDAALKALSLDNNLAEAHAALANIIIRYDIDFIAAEKELQRALELDPKWADTYQRYSELYSFLGRHEEALAKVRQGLEIEPFSLPLNVSYGGALVLARRYDEAIGQLKRTLEMDPNFRNTHVELGRAYWLKGMQAEAVDERARALELAGLNEFAARIREAFAAGGWNGFLRAEKERFPTVERTIERAPYFGEAIILTALGEKEMAFATLDKSIAADEKPALVFLKVEPRLDPLRDDPRYKDWLKKVGFPE